MLKDKPESLDFSQEKSADTRGWWWEWYNGHFLDKCEDEKAQVQRFHFLPDKLSNHSVSIVVTEEEANFGNCNLYGEGDKNLPLLAQRRVSLKQ